MDNYTPQIQSLGMRLAQVEHKLDHLFRHLKIESLLIV